MKNEVTVIHTAYEDGPKAVATVDVEGEDEMLRSTSVGDEMLYEGKRYRVKKYGFGLLSEE